MIRNFVPTAGTTLFLMQSYTYEIKLKLVPMFQRILMVKKGLDLENKSTTLLCQV